jgi:hypothetical protein
MRVLMVAVAATALVGLMASEATAVPDTGMVWNVSGRGSGPATAQDYKGLLKQLKGLSESIKELETLTSGEGGWQRRCRGYSPEKTVRCAAVKFDPPGGVSEAVSVWSCESNFGTESPHTDAYHGPFQYMYSTYEGQQNSMPDVVEWYELSPAVHDMRSNILTAVAWAARHGWGPWSCA